MRTYWGLCPEDASLLKFSAHRTFIDSSLIQDKAAYHLQVPLNPPSTTRSLPISSAVTSCCSSSPAQVQHLVLRPTLASSLNYTSAAGAGTGATHGSKCTQAIITDHNLLLSQEHAPNSCIYTFHHRCWWYWCSSRGGGTSAKHFWNWCRAEAAASWAADPITSYSKALVHIRSMTTQAKDLQLFAQASPLMQ